MTQDAECRSCFVLKPNRATQFFAFHFSLRIHPFANLEFLERLDSLSGSWQHTEDVESDLDSKQHQHVADFAPARDSLTVLLRGLH